MTPGRDMKHEPASPKKGHMSSSTSRGFTLLEALIAITIVLIVSGISFMSLRPAWQDARLNGAYNGTLMTLRQARQWAVDNRKTYLVTFNPGGIPPGTNMVQINRMDAGVIGPIVNQMTLPPDIQFLNVSGIPNTLATTPDGLGTGGQPIEFDIGVSGGVSNQIYFFPDGSSRDINNNINNGIVYLARPTDLYSSRAITLMGAAGRIRGWRLYASSVGVPHWSEQ
ncbi:MAG TPA: prepilin-type N-terminal cleavage/methylation domain-containing protein [Terriglobales bacterium]|jgi:prepilin-type N-terminal cleavage/methylation domain-containing protein|nr:prepilin-type N-terminal cleavage/methylation domain-containing protein [Terriglobales bacterium]